MSIMKTTTETKSPRRKRRDASKIEATLHDVLDTVDAALDADGLDASGDCRVWLLAAQAQGRGEDMAAFWRCMALERGGPVNVTVTVPLDGDTIYEGLPRRDR